MQTTVSTRSSSMRPSASCSARCLAAATSAATFSSLPLKADILDFTLNISFLTKAFASSVASSSSSSSIRDRILVASSPGSWAEASVSAIASRSFSESSWVARAAALATALATRLSAFETLACRSATLLFSAARLSDSCFAFASSSARFSLALASDLAISTTERRRAKLPKATPPSEPKPLIHFSAWSSVGVKSYSALANATISSLLSLPSPSASNFANAAFCSSSFFAAAASAAFLFCSAFSFAAAFSLAALTRFERVADVLLHSASLMKRGLNSDFSASTACLVTPSSAFFSIRLAEALSIVACAPTRASSTVCTASKIPSTVRSSSASFSVTGTPSAVACATCASACTTSSVASFVVLSIRKASSFSFTSSSSLFVSSAIFFMAISSIFSWTCCVAFSASCITFSACDPIASRFSV
mmetsp:Transcript_70696/g.184335  ORF Transcript_70696/g.184335 Transcript_70696/m.184335 type:complete len:419 (-) Transcript_70696:960-2216(-)